jgi:hypothetical protein
MLRAAGFNAGRLDEAEREKARSPCSKQIKSPSL